MGTPRGLCRLTPGRPLLCPGRLEQLGFNALLQLMIGVPLEMVHGILRISFLYLAGVLAGGCSLGGPVPIPPWVPVTSPRRARGGACRVWWGCWALLAATCQLHLTGSWGATQAVIN